MTQADLENQFWLAYFRIKAKPPVVIKYKAMPSIEYRRSA